MVTKEINKLLIDEKNYIGTFARDLLPNNLPLRRKAGLIVNTDTHDLPVEHWIAIYLDGNGRGEYFDSYGLPPLHKEFIDFMRKNCRLGWCWNLVTLQCLTCITCGQYCLIYIKLTLNNYYAKGRTIFGSNFSPDLSDGCNQDGYLTGRIVAQ